MPLCSKWIVPFIDHNCCRVVGSYNVPDTGQTCIVQESLVKMAKTEASGRCGQKETYRKFGPMKWIIGLKKKLKKSGVRKYRPPVNCYPLESFCLLGHRRWWVISWLMQHKVIFNLIISRNCQWFWDSNSNKKVWQPSLGHMTIHWSEQMAPDYLYTETLPMDKIGYYDHKKVWLYSEKKKTTNSYVWQC